MRPTVVTAYYHMPSKYPRETYFQWLQLFLRTVNCNLVYFVENEEMKEKLIKLASWPERIHFITLQKDNWTSLKRKSISFWENQLEMNEAEVNLHKSFLLGAIWNEKMYFVERAMELDPFHSNIFIWVDAGIMRSEVDANAGFLFGCDERVIPNDKFHILQVGPIKDDQGEYWNPNQAIEVRFGGGILGGTKTAWKTVIPLYESMMEELIEHKICVFKDQIVWANIIRKKPELFHVIQAYDDWFHLLRLWSKVPSNILPTFVINLEKRMDRWLEIKGKWNFDENVFRFPALAHGAYSPWLHKRIVHGCASSHLSIIACCNGKPCLTLEDDADPADEHVTLDSLRNLIFLALKENVAWDLINFGTSTLSGLHQQSFGAIRLLPVKEFHQTKITSTTHAIAYNKNMVNYSKEAIQILSHVLWTAETNSNIDFIFGSGTLLPNIVQLIPSEKILSRQRVSLSDLSNSVTNYNHFFDIVDSQLHWIQKSWIPVSSPLIIEMMGGLGNQLFIAAAGFYFARKTGRPLALLRKPLQENPHSSTNYMDTIFSKFPQIQEVPNYFCSIIEESNDEEKEILAINSTIPCKLKGYFQRSLYATEEFKATLNLPKVVTTEEKRISIHIRGTDYLKVPLHNVDLTSFRNKVMHYSGTYPITVFTDDPTYAKDVMKKLNISNYEFSSSANEVEDLLQLSNNSGPLIGCNSTFSWWACAFSATNRLRFLPQAWFNGSQAPSTKRLLNIEGVYVV
jgi:Bacterial protein of unknown function (HtrL_YibB)